MKHRTEFLSKQELELEIKKLFFNGRDLFYSYKQVIVNQYEAGPQPTYSAALDWLHKHDHGGLSYLKSIYQIDTKGDKSILELYEYTGPVTRIIVDQTWMTNPDTFLDKVKIAIRLMRQFKDLVRDDLDPNQNSLWPIGSWQFNVLPDDVYNALLRNLEQLYDLVQDYHLMNNSLSSKLEHYKFDGKIAQLVFNVL